MREEQVETSQTRAEQVDITRIGEITEEQAAQQIEQVCRRIIRLRQRPLLVLYYPGPYGQIGEDDVRDCYQAFRVEGANPEEPLQDCDVLIHTFGGDPVAAYRLSQVIRDFANHVYFLVPEYAYSAGTLLCFSGNRICLGHYAGLSPIDITTESEDGEGRRGRIEYTSIDYFMEFATESQNKIQGTLQSMGLNVCATTGSDLLCRLVDQVGALKVGEYYRARTLTGHYAQELLDRYMLAGLPNARGRRNKIISSLLFGAPAHEFHLDFHMCSDTGLALDEMPTNESDLTKELVTLLNDLTQRNIICPNITDFVKMPFVVFYR